MVACEVTGMADAVMVGASAVGTSDVSSPELPPVAAELGPGGFSKGAVAVR